MARKFRLFALGVAAVLFLYGFVGMIGGAIPANRDWTPPTEGIRIYVEDNGVHTSIVLPAAGWENIVRPEHLRDPRYARHAWRSFGWGDRDFYVETPTWWDVRPWTVLKGAVRSDASVMHVDAVAEPTPGGSVRAVTVRPEDYARLIGYIRASFAGGAPRPGYFGYDAFYPAHGHYSAIRTCNAWTGDALRHAGIRIGAWTPFPVTVMWWLN